MCCERSVSRLSMAVTHRCSQPAKDLHKIKSFQKSNMEEEEVADDPPLAEGLMVIEGMEGHVSLGLEMTIDQLPTPL